MEEEVAKSDRVSSWKINIKNQYIGDFLDGSDCKESACNAGDLGLIPGEGNGNPLQYSCLENPVDRRAWRVTVHRVAQSQTQLSDFHDYC